MQRVHYLHHGFIIDGFIRAEEDGGVFLAAGQLVQRGNNRGIRYRIVAEEHGFIRLHRQVDGLFRTRLRLAGGRRQIHLHVHRRQRRGNHKDNQQNQHDVDKRRHVDLMHFTVIVQIFIKTHCHTINLRAVWTPHVPV